MPVHIPFSISLMTSLSRVDRMSAAAAQEESSNALSDILARLLALLPNILAAVVIFGLGMLAASWISVGLRRVMERRKADKQATFIFSRIAYWIILILTTFTALQTVGFNITAFLAGLGILGFTIGFALQDVSKNFIAGLIMMVDRPFNLGDVIQVGDFTGVVDVIDIRATRIKTLDGRIVLIPNGDVFTSPIVNFTQTDKRRVELALSVTPETESRLARQAALDAILGVPGLLSDPAPQAVMQNITAVSQDLILYFWIDTAKTDTGNAKDAGLEAVKAAFGKEGIKMPEPVGMMVVGKSTKSGK